MITKVGMQGNFLDALTDLIELEYDAVEAYQTAINRLRNDHIKQQFEDFLRDHQRHIQEGSDYLNRQGREAPRSASAKSIITQGKVVIADIMGDTAILRAMRSNELDTNTAYERMVQMAPQDCSEMLRRAYEDERRHLNWIETQLQDEAA
ncbi:MAG: DUF892 family protein [Holosporales bacterium]